MTPERIKKLVEMLQRVEAMDVGHIAPFASLATDDRKPESAVVPLPTEKPGGAIGPVEPSHVHRVLGCRLGRNSDIMMAED